jgi:demethylmenaquinone methyltransferase / 2-methoxy-6-polyprenyl-1,4-benzoquinol methylase
MSHLPKDEEKAGVVRSMFDRIAPRYDLINRMMTFGQDVSWRRKAVAELRLPFGATVIDVACGTGDLCRELEAAGLQAVGFDFSFGMLSAARTNVSLVQADALKLPLSDGSVDGVTCGFAVRNVLDIETLFHEFARVTVPRGRLAILEVAEPNGAFTRAGHKLYFHHVVPFVGGLLSDKDAYRYLPESTAYLPPTKTLVAMLDEAGFTARAERLMMGAAQMIVGTRR